jgi:hypothetical protein
MRWRARCEAPWHQDELGAFIEIGASAIRLHGRFWHTDCAVRYNRQRAQARGELISA